MGFADGHVESRKIRTFGLFASATDGWPRDDELWKQW
jgi:hypothetical protein